MVAWDLLDWLAALGALAGIITTAIVVWRLFKPTAAANQTTVSVKNSPGATTAGRDINGDGGNGDNSATVNVDGSEGATTAGRDS